jgi:pimeloyl-[acyl-carrier protein] methyl ester esterase
MSPQICFVHGWGFHAGVWESLCSNLDGLGTVNFYGPHFVEGGPAVGKQVIEDAICIGFSLGVPWLLKCGPKRMRALISIAGFDYLRGYRAEQAIIALKRGLERSPAAQMRAFWAESGIRPFVSPDALDVPGLKLGLQWMSEWDGRRELSELTCPVLALAAKDDSVIAAETTQMIWGARNLKWSESGGHALPLTQPAWCAEQIQRFIKQYVS